jgi:hypothetical protein
MRNSSEEEVSFRFSLYMIRVKFYCLFTNKFFIGQTSSAEQPRPLYLQIRLSVVKCVLQSTEHRCII